MKAYKITGYILDFENNGAEELKTILHNVKHVSISNLKLQEAEIGEWHDDHPLNKYGVDYEPFFNTTFKASGEQDMFSLREIALTMSVIISVTCIVLVSIYLHKKINQHYVEEFVKQECLK